MDERIFLNPFWRCECDKLHVRSNLAFPAYCTCGRPIPLD